MMSNINLIKNLILLKLGVPSPFSAVFWITDKCNSRCRMCNIWKLKERNGMELDVFEKMFQRSKILRQISLFSFTGGEPFLKKDLVEFIKVLNYYANPKEIRIATNGISTNKILSDVSKILELTSGRFTVKLSLDGIGNSHEKIRGIKGCYKRMLDTMEGLEKLKKKHPKKLNIVVGFTATSLNYKEIDKVFNLSKKKNFGFFYKPVMKAKKLETQSVKNNVFLKDGQKKYLKNFHRKLYKRLSKRHFNERISYNYFYRYLDRYYENPSRIVPCYACSASFHIAANWDVFSCVKLNHVIGNIREKSFDEIWNSKSTREFREKIRKTNCYCLCSGEMIPSLITYKFPFLLSKRVVETTCQK